MTIKQVTFVLLFGSLIGWAIGSLWNAQDRLELLTHDRVSLKEMSRVQIAFDK